MRQHVNPLSHFFQLPLSLPSKSILFKNSDYPIHLDIGSAKGEFLIELAINYPNWNFLGLEIREQLVSSSESKRKKFAYGFRDENQRAEYVEKWFSDLASNRKHQVEKKAKAQADSEEFAKTLSVGDILHCPWGYSMSLNDFFQIVGFTPSRKSVKVRKLNKYLKDSDGYGQMGHETCRKDDFATDNVRTLRIRDGYVRVSSHQIAYKWDGLPKYYNSMD